MCTNQSQQICNGTSVACVRSFWNFAGGDRYFWTNTNETSGDVVGIHGYTDQWSYELRASFNPSYYAMAFTTFCDGPGFGGSFDLRGKRLTAYVYINALSYGGYAARCRISAYNPQHLFPWVNNPPLNTWFPVTANFTSVDSAIVQIGVECDLPAAWNDGEPQANPDPERWYVDDVQIFNN
jgi:hypothetical protein